MDLGPRVVFTFGFGRDVTMLLKGLALAPAVSK